MLCTAEQFSEEHGFVLEVLGHPQWGTTPNHNRLMTVMHDAKLFGLDQAICIAKSVNGALWQSPDGLPLGGSKYPRSSVAEFKIRNALADERCSVMKNAWGIIMHGAV